MSQTEINPVSNAVNLVDLPLPLPLPLGARNSDWPLPTQPTNNDSYPLLMISFVKRGNQRERDRERAQARAGHNAKHPKDEGLTPEQRRERDARALQEKAARKAAQAAAGGNNAGGGGGKSVKK
ncbi:unnamed protein product [Dovyalis caffra]|uniref:Small EDRK-rich factor-like N-terminal domain-containing protein n=1 Tax=Dovyalis caffra TaxID=77055 RepID=A0AAV1SA79_9ROSI|nr:unnamed protein product [Dovyalis caffra]